MEIEPATITQLQRARDGRLVEIEADVGGVAAQLREIDPGLRLRYAEASDIFIVYHRTSPRPGWFNEELVLTARQLDGRILERVRQIAARDYDFLAELDRIDAEADRAQEARFADQVGDAAQRLAHALRRDRGVKNRAAI